MRTAKPDATSAVRPRRNRRCRAARRGRRARGERRSSPHWFFIIVSDPQEAGPETFVLFSARCTDGDPNLVVRWYDMTLVLLSVSGTQRCSALRMTASSTCTARTG